MRISIKEDFTPHLPQLLISSGVTLGLFALPEDYKQMGAGIGLAANLMFGMRAMMNFNEKRVLLINSYSTIAKESALHGIINSTLKMFLCFTFTFPCLYLLDINLGLNAALTLFTAAATAFYTYKLSNLPANVETQIDIRKVSEEELPAVLANKFANAIYATYHTPTILNIDSIKQALEERFKDASKNHFAPILRVENRYTFASKEEGIWGIGFLTLGTSKAREQAASVAAKTALYSNDSNPYLYIRENDFTYLVMKVPNRILGAKMQEKFVGKREGMLVNVVH